MTAITKLLQLRYNTDELASICYVVLPFQDLFGLLGPFSSHGSAAD